MKFGDNNNAMGVSSIASPCTIIPQVQSLYHPWLWSPGGLYRNWELVHEISLVSTEIGSLSMKFGDNDNAMGVWSFASPSTAKSQDKSL